MNSLARAITALILSAGILFSQSIVYATEGGTHISSAQGEVVTTDAVAAVNWAYSGSSL